MAVFLGNNGNVELKRTQLDEEIFGTVAPSDVNENKDRLSFTFPVGMLITGDKVEIKSTASPQQNLDFIDPSGWPTNTVYPDGIFYIYVDEVGGIRLYRSFDDAMSGEVKGRIPLNAITTSYPIEIEIHNNVYRILGQVRNFELNTERDVVDISNLSDEFRKQYSGLISGSGRINCFFEYERRLCDSMTGGVSRDLLELPIYLNQLLLRTKLGSEFSAKLTLIGRGPKPGGYRDDFDDEIWYEFDARITNVGMSFEPTELIETSIDFVTTGDIKLRTRFVTNYLVQEDAFSRLRQEDNQNPDDFITVEQEE